MSFTSPLAWYWVLAPLLAAMVAIFLLVAALWHLSRCRFVAGGSHAAGGLVLGLLALAAALVLLNTQGFVRLTGERGIADVTVAALDPGARRYRVVVTRLDVAARPIGCIVQGDEWLLSARVQKWKPWATILGLDATYRLDQVANKYFAAGEANGRPITACDLSGAPAPGVAGWRAWLLAQAYAEQRRFGSAVYMPLADGAIYRVTMTQAGLNAEAVNPIAVAAVRQRI